MASVSPRAIDEFKDRARATWAAGDWPLISLNIINVGGALVDMLGVSAGQRVLDVGAGCGSAAIPAAQRGARVTASDLTPELFDEGRRRAAEAGVELDWVEADAEQLPFEDGSFDVVMSTFGAMFAPRHDVVARELVRVTAPGGVIANAAWTPEGWSGERFRIIGSFLPEPPAFAQPPILWGDEAHVRELFADLPVTVAFERRVHRFVHEDAERSHNDLIQYFGPLIMARKVLEPQGRWDELVAAMRDHQDRWNRATDGSVDIPAEYLVTIVRPQAA